jgi:hypothetical protein
VLASATLELKALEIEIEQEKLNATIKRASSGERIASHRVVRLWMLRRPTWR